MRVRRTGSRVMGLVTSPASCFRGSFDKREVRLFDLPLGELSGEMAVGSVGAGNQQDAAGAFVEAVDDAGAEVAADFGKRGEVVQQGIDEGAGVAAGAGVDDEAGGLVDCDDIGVFVEDVEGNVLRGGFEGLQLLGFDLDGVTEA